jgi:hypothetical protein
MASMAMCLRKIYRFGQQYINIPITILDIIHCPLFCLKHDILETGLCFRLQVESTQFGLIDGTSLSPDGCSSACSLRHNGKGMLQGHFEYERMPLDSSQKPCQSCSGNLQREIVVMETKKNNKCK